MFKTKKSKFPAAVFGPKTWAALFAVKASPETDGTGLVSGSGLYGYGKIAELVAQPAAGYEFAGWSDDVTENPRSFTVTHAVRLTASFRRSDQKSVLTYRPNKDFVNV